MPCAGNTAAAALLIVLCTLVVTAELHDAAPPPPPAAIRPPSRRKYLLPILLYGPSNQVIGLKEGLMYARLLGRTAVLPSLYDHFSQLPVVEKALSLRQHRAWDFGDIFDQAAMANFTRVRTMADFMRVGPWSGRLDALLYWQRKPDLDYLWRLQTHGISAETAVNITLRRRSNTCQAQGLREIRTLTHRHRVVGLVVYNRLVTRANKRLLQEPSITDPDALCYSAYRNVSAHLVKSNAIRDLAARFVAERLSGLPFVALHIRPYPDACMDVWKVQRRPTPRRCANHLLHKQVGREAAAAVALAGLNGRPVYVASHPGIRPMIVHLLKAHNLTVVHWDPGAQAGAAAAAAAAAAGELKPSPQSLTYDMFVEQEIAMLSTTFIGTKESTITGIIRQQRTVSGIPVDRSLTFGGPSV